MKIKSAWLLAAALVLAPALGARAQERPEEVASYVKRPMSHEWYVRQAALWRDAVDKEHGNAPAWFNYFLASRYSGFDGSNQTKEFGEKMKRIVTEMEAAIPNTYEFNLAKWWNGGNTLELFPYLQRAYELRPDYAELSTHFIPYYELSGNYDQVKFFSRKWFESADFPESLLSYNYNVLMSLEKDAVLVTAGDLDTFPIWLLQHAKGIRPDVTVMNVGLMGAPEYRARMMKEHAIEGESGEMTSEAEFFKSVAEGNTRRPVYFALTVDPSITDLIKDDLYTVGLANRYSPKRIDNIALLKKNWESFRLDYLDLDFYGDQSHYSNELITQIAMNYVTPAYLLYEHYMLSGERERAEKLRQLALAVGRAGGQEDAVRDYFESAGQGAAADVPMLGQEKDDAKGEDAAWSLLVRVAPNPATTELTVGLPEDADAKYELSDLQGNVVRSLAQRGAEAKIDLSGLPAGAYVLRVSAGTHSASKPVKVVR